MGSKAELQVDDDDHILNEDAIDSVTLHRQIGKLKRQLVVKNNKKTSHFRSLKTQYIGTVLRKVECML